tara:strand:- start:2891 stop:3295 length:405 start_codon:yes stop_codon:yes gene_type:complete
MGASLYNFEIEQGSSFKMSLIYKDSAGAVIDLTDWCARLIWKTSANATQTFDSSNTNKTSYDFNIEGPLGKINLLFPAGTTNGFDFNTAKYDLELQSDEDHYNQGGKYVIRLLYGTVTIQKRYSKSSTALECNT